MDFVDKSFNSTECIKYRLSIQISLNGFSFCIFDTETQKHVMLKSYPYSASITDYNSFAKEVGSLLNNIPVSNIPVKCLFITHKNTLIPDEIFSEKKIRSFMSFLFPLEELDEIHYNYIPSVKGYCGCIIPSPVAAEIGVRFHGVKFYSQAYLSVQQTLSKAEATKLRVIFCPNFIDISVVKDNVLILNNSFEISDIKDAVYFISALINKFELKDSPIYLAGDISLTEVKNLKNYFPALIQEQNKRIALLFGHEISLNHYNLLSLHECE